VKEVGGTQAHWVRSTNHGHARKESSHDCCQTKGTTLLRNVIYRVI
jgi:hypothetical protein